MHKMIPEKMFKDETRSNHAVQAMSYLDCPNDRACFGIATGFGGGIVDKCKHFNADEGFCSAIKDEENG